MKGCSVTAKLKTYWLKKLEIDGYLGCEVPGCSQTYVTISNFMTHYKYCIGTKNLQHCIYCSLIFSSHNAVFHHIEIEHPENVDTFKAQCHEDKTKYDESSILIDKFEVNCLNKNVNLEVTFEKERECESSQVNFYSTDEGNENSTTISCAGSEQIDHSKPNQKNENIISDIKIKKPQGTPRKNQNVGVTHISKALNFSNCSLTIDKLDDINDTYTVDNSHSQQKIEFASQGVAFVVDDLKSGVEFLKRNKKNSISTPAMASNFENTCVPCKIDKFEVNNLTKNVNSEVSFEEKKDWESSQVNYYSTNEGNEISTAMEISCAGSEQTDHSEPNQKNENIISDIKIKKPRGRPRKNKNVGMTDISKVLNLSECSLNIDESNDINDSFSIDNSRCQQKIEFASQGVAFVVDDLKSGPEFLKRNKKISISTPAMASNLENTRVPCKIDNFEVNNLTKNVNSEVSFEEKKDWESSQVNYYSTNEGNEISTTMEISGYVRSEKTVHSELNQKRGKIISNVKVKKPRGRPRKNKNVGMTDISKVLKLSKCSLNIDESNDINDSFSTDNSRSQQKIEIASQGVAFVVDDLKSSVEFLETNKKFGISTPLMPSNLENASVPCKIDNFEVNHLDKNVNLEMTFEEEKDCESGQVNYSTNEGDENSTIMEISGYARSEQTVHSEPNQKRQIVISDVKVKKPRGRPRKNQNVGVTHISKALNLSKSSLTIDNSDDINDTFSVDNCRSKQKIELASQRVAFVVDDLKSIEEFLKTNKKIGISTPVMASNLENAGVPCKVDNFEGNRLTKNVNLEVTFEEKDCKSSQVNSYKTNEGDENSTTIQEIKVKKPRGRPRKKQNVGMTHVSTAFNLSKCSLTVDKSDDINDSYTVDNSISQQKVEIISQGVAFDVDDLKSSVELLKTNKKIGISTPLMASNLENVCVPWKVANFEVNHLPKNVNLEVTNEEKKHCKSSQVNSYSTNKGDENSTIMETSGCARSKKTVDSESNKKKENVILDVKVKKARGRPRKNQNVGMTDISKVLNLSKCSLNIDESDDENACVPCKVDNYEVNILSKNMNLEVAFEGKMDCESSRVNSYNTNEGEENSTTVGISGCDRSEQVYHSEPNQKSENIIPDVKVKKSRGRPRKKQNLGMTDTFKALRLSKCSLNIDKSYDIKHTYNKGIKSETLLSVADARKQNIPHKTERLKKLKLTKNKFCGSSQIEKDSDTASRGRRRRGRPRKILSKDFVVNILDNETNFAVEKALNEEPKSFKNKLFKYSCRGRPRKYEKHANRNLDFDMSSHFYRLNSNIKKKGRPIKIDGGRKEKPQNLKYKEKVKRAEQSETMNILLKKRKRKTSQRDDFVYQNVYASKSDTDESSLDAEEDFKIDSEDVIRESKSKQQHQNLRNHKNVDVMSAKKKSVRRNSWDPEFVLSHSSCKRDISRIIPVIHKKSLRDIIQSDKETSDAGKDCINIDSKSSSPKGLVDTSFVHHKRSSKSIIRSKKLRKAALRDYFQAAGNLFSDFKPQKCTWKPLKDYYLFCPPMRFSPYFKTKETWNGHESNWISLSVFESAPIDRESYHCTFFTGGPVSCSAWCPTSSEDKNIQYIALAVNFSLETRGFYDQTDSKKGLLQLWSVGTLNDKKLNSKISMQLSIAYDYGPITDMAWCPKGCWEDPTTKCLDDSLPRLGMLAVACSDGDVRVYSIPHPGFLMEESTFPMYESCPSITLKPMFGERCKATRKSMCTCLSWQKSDYCERVAAGYGNGMICVWHITNVASILVSKENYQTNFNPYLVFKAHGTPVTSISFAPLPDSRYLVSSSYDKSLKFWDLQDISLPFFTVKKGPARCAEWANHYCGVFASLDNGMNCVRGSSFFKECGTEFFPSHSLSNTSCFVTKSTMSGYLEAEALVDISGSASVSFFCNLFKDSQKSPYYFHRPVYLTEIVAVEGIMDKIAFLSYLESSVCLSVIKDMKEIVTLMNEVTETVSRKNLDADSVDNSEDCGTKRSCSTSISKSNLESKSSNINTKDLHCINISDELITQNSLSKFCKNKIITNNQSNKCISLIQNFEDQNENKNVDQLMFGESENFKLQKMFSSVENMTDLLLCDSKPSLSEDSLTSECSLNTNISSSHFSSESDMIPTSSSDSESVDHGLNTTFLSTSTANNITDASLLSPACSSTSISGVSQVLSYKRKDKCEKLKKDSTALNFLDPEKVILCQNDETKRTELISTFNDKIVPSFLGPATSIPSANPSPLSNEINRMENVEASLESAAFHAITLEANRNESGNKILDSAIFTNSSKRLHSYGWNSGDIFSINKLCDINSGCHKMSKNCAQSDCNIAKTVPNFEKNTFDFKRALNPIVNNDCGNDNKVKTNETTDSQLCDKNPPPFTSSSYENVLSRYGLVFKDMNTAHFKSIKDIKTEEDNSLLHDGYNLASLKTAAWNPNYGSHFWLFSAGQSGLARISYISDMNESDVLPKVGGNNS